MNGPTGTPDRRGLAERVLGAGGYIGETPVEALEASVESYVRLLEGAGAVSGSVVAVEEGEARGFYAVVLASWLLDAVPLPCAAADKAPYAAHAFTVRRDGEVRPPAEDRVIDGLDATAVLHVTSGSTGEPKLARRSCASVVNEAEGYRRGLLRGPEERVYIPIPLSHSFGWGVALGTLLAGARLDALPVVHARRAAARLEAATVSAITAPVAALLASVPRAPQAPAGGLRIAMVGASRVTAVLDDAFHERFGIRLTRNYGSSETGATFMGAAGLPEGFIGRPMHGIAILAPEAGAVGELVLAVPEVQGQVGAAEPPTSVWATGDSVRCERDGTVAFLARLRADARLNDRNVDIHGLERLLRGLAHVDDVFPLVLARPTGASDDLYVVVAGADVDPSLVERSRTEFPDGTRGARLIYCDTLPVTPTGKVDRPRVIELAHASRSR